MVTDNHYRWDFIQLSTDEKPTPATSPKVADGSTLYTSDDSKLYIWYKDQWYEKEVAGGGTTYTAGDGIDITNDTISIDDTYVFTGTDGTAVGTTGLVPAPAITDAGKFLKADGTWSAAGGGGIKTLTTADYNYPAGNPNGIAIWLLPQGWYQKESKDVAMYLNSNTRDNSSNIVIYVGAPAHSSGGDSTLIPVFFWLNVYTNIYYDMLDSEAGSSGFSWQHFIIPIRGIKNELTVAATNPDFVLDARQGKVLKDLIDGLDARITALGG